MKTSTDLIIDAVEAITKAGGSPRTLMAMSLSEAIATLHKNGLHLTLVDVNETPVKVDEVWISNIGRDKYSHPETLSGYSLIEVKYRCGKTEFGRANHWTTCWETVGCYPFDIVAYRILKRLK